VPASACRPVNAAVIALDAKVLTGNAQPRTREEHEAFLLAAFDPEDVFDFSNPEDKAEFIGSIGGPSEADSGQPRPLAASLGQVSSRGLEARP
jgi:hypothetical protein